jgi:hypothetical protein
MVSWLNILGAGSNFSLLGHGTDSIILNIIVLLVIIYLLVIPSLIIVNLYKYSKQELSLLELIPPGFSDVSLESLEKLFIGVYGLSSLISFKDRLLKTKPCLSFEIVASDADGIKFIAAVPKDQADNLKKIIRAALPGMEINVAKDYLPALDKAEVYKISEFKLKNSFYFPLKDSSSTTLIYQAGLANLEANEAVAVQLVITPLPPVFNRRAIRKLEARKSNKSGWLIKLVRWSFRAIQLAFGSRPIQAKLSTATEAKLTSPLFSAGLRIIVTGETKDQVNDRNKTLRSGLASLSSPGQQALVSRALPKQVIATGLKHRLPGLLKDNLFLSPHELACLYHFPGFSDPGRQDTKKSLSRVLPMDHNARTTEADIVIGENHFEEKSSPIALSKSERARHVYIIGGTGNGKTTMIEYMANQDIKNGKGVMVVDPHGDLAENLLKRVPKQRIADVIYFNQIIRLD